MYIRNHLANVVDKFAIVIIAASGLWLEFATFGDQAWRLLDVWFLLVTAVYYGVNGLYSLIQKTWQGKMICPMLNGMVVTAGLGLLVARIAGATGTIDILGLEGFGCFLVNFLLPIGVFLDWLILVKKGTWHPVDPWYWLGLMLSYAGMIILTARSAGGLVYPYSFLDYTHIGIDTMVWWIALVSLIILVIGYSLFLLDFALSGAVHRYIVLPKIKTIIIEEEIEDIERADRPKGPKGLKELKEPKKAEQPAVAVEPAPAKTVKKPAQKIVVEELKDKKSAQNLHGTKNRSTSNKPESRPKQATTSKKPPLSKDYQVKPKEPTSKATIQEKKPKKQNKDTANQPSAKTGQTAKKSKKAPVSAPAPAKPKKEVASQPPQNDQTKAK